MSEAYLSSAFVSSDMVNLPSKQSEFSARFSLAAGYDRWMLRSVSAWNSACSVWSYVLDKMRMFLFQCTIDRSVDILNFVC